jgi:hypothetical protein
MNAAQLAALAADIDRLRVSVGVEGVRMADGTARDVNLTRVFTDTLAAVRAGEPSPWHAFLAGVDEAALDAEGDTGERLFLLAVARGMALDEAGAVRVVPDMSEDAPLANEKNAEREPDELDRELEAARERTRRFNELDDKTWSELTDDERRWVRHERIRRRTGRMQRR